MKKEDIYPNAKEVKEVHIKKVTDITKVISLLQSEWIVIQAYNNILVCIRL